MPDIVLFNIYYLIQSLQWFYKVFNLILLILQGKGLRLREANYFLQGCIPSDRAEKQTRIIYLIFFYQMFVKLNNVWNVW